MTIGVVSCFAHALPCGLYPVLHLHSFFSAVALSTHLHSFGVTRPVNWQLGICALHCPSSRRGLSLGQTHSLFSLYILSFSHLTHPPFSRLKRLFVLSRHSQFGTVPWLVVPVNSEHCLAGNESNSV